ncbi:triphosphoribosyl-dephospho-CoA synthase [Planctomicrobium sp. SH668]|uniref:triphosphoribosyl-dephospho-CoA synthase n=1 Tax=Planctomicrobium sp. SH668 TaxID=3448126 RepID=UPI003F5BA8CA
MTAVVQSNSNTLAAFLQSACLLECTAPKPGNVSPGKRFADLTYDDFVRSAEVIAPILAVSADSGVGQAILNAVKATRSAVGTNTNLGMVLLLAPLAAIPLGISCAAGIESVLRGIDLSQTALIYEAIRHAQPGGLGEVDQNDVSQTPQITILEAMAQVPSDKIAWQYTHSYEDVLGFGCERFLARLSKGQDELEAIVGLHLDYLANQSDSLILRKCGEEVAIEAQRRANRIVSLETSDNLVSANAIEEFDLWLRGDGHRRNPGTTADLIAATLFSLMRDGVWQPVTQPALSRLPVQE